MPDDWKLTSPVRRKPCVSVGIGTKILQRPEVIRVKYAPGTGTLYDVMLVPLGGMEVPGTYTMADPEGQKGSKYWLLCLLNGSEMCYPVTADVHWTYLNTKLKCGEVAARALEELIQYLLEGKDRHGPPEEVR